MSLQELGFGALCVVTLVGAFGAVSQRNLTRALLSVVVFFFGMAALFFSLHAEMLGAVQILIYVGAVAVMMVYAIVLTRSSDEGVERKSGLPLWGAALASLVGALLVGAVMKSPELNRMAGPNPEDTTRQLAHTLLGTYALPFEIVSLLLTAAMVGAVVIALDELRSAAGKGRARG